MDPFKLLTKGTTLSNNTNKPKSLVMPSAGPANDQQNLAMENSDGQNEVLPSRLKRKRNNDTRKAQAYQADVMQAPDFFNAGTGEQAPASRADVVEETRTTEPQDNIENPPSSWRSEEECKQILKRHKLKVTLLHPPMSKDRQLKEIKSRFVQLTPQPFSAFAELRSRFNISRRLAANLAEQGYSIPTEVQLAAIPILMGNDKDRGLPRLSKSQRSADSPIDLLSIAPTGSGKTLAFLIPLVQGILDLNHQETATKDAAEAHIKAVILAPTHELADQIMNEARKLTQGTGIRVAGMRKGMHVVAGQDYINTNNEIDAIIKADVLISTPLALVNAISEGFSQPQSIPSVNYLVLDEADVLLDPLFREQSLSIWKACTNQFLQVSLWSATIGASIEQLSQEFISSRRRDLGLPSKHHHIIRLIAGLKDSALPTISHRLIYAATEQGKLLAIRQILHPTTNTSGPTLCPPYLIFTQTIPRAAALHSELRYDIPVEAGGSSRVAVLHSSLSDTARSEIMARFRKGEIWILITTDLLSRGVDFRGVNGVVNYDIPTTSAAYVHRAGRTGRAGREGGVAITLYTKEDIPYVKNVANVIAASERAHGKRSSNLDGEGVPRWLLEALPKVGKKTKKELKQHGVAERRSGTKGTVARISTKSGFQRREDNRKKDAVAATRKRKFQLTEGNEAGEEAGNESEWAGIED